MLPWALADLPRACGQGRRLLILIYSLFLNNSQLGFFYSLSEIPREGLAPAVTREHAGRREPGRAEKSPAENVFGLVARRRRKPAAAGSHAEIRQPCICSTPACLEKYRADASKRSFNGAPGFFGFTLFLGSA